MADVKINESNLKVTHQPKTENKPGSENQVDTTQKAPGVDVEAIVELCVERVFELLNEKYER